MTVCQAMADERRSLLEEIDRFASPVAVSGLDDGQLGGFDALFAPGGHASMVDVPHTPGVSRLVGSLHARGAPIAALGHGPRCFSLRPNASTLSGCSKASALPRSPTRRRTRTTSAGRACRG